MPRKKERPFEWITGKEAAEILHLSDRHVRRLGTLGKLEMKEISPRVRLFLKSDVETYSHKTKEQNHEQ